MCLSMVLRTQRLRVRQRRLVLLIRQLRQAGSVGPQRSNLILCQCCLQRPVESVALECFGPAVLVGAKIRAPSGQLAGRINQNTLLFGTNDAHQRTLAVRPPAGDTCPLRYVPPSDCCLGHRYQSSLNPNQSDRPRLSRPGRALDLSLPPFLAGLPLLFAAGVATSSISASSSRPSMSSYAAYSS